MGGIGQSTTDAGIVKVRTQWVGQWDTIYENGVYFPDGPVEYPEGGNWEVTVYVSGYNPTGTLVNPWTMCVAIVAPSTPHERHRKQIKASSMNGKGPFVQDFSFNMGDMPKGGVTIESILYWTSDASVSHADQLPQQYGDWSQHGW